jgi:hypothetical protein
MSPEQPSKKTTLPKLKTERGPVNAPRVKGTPKTEALITSVLSGPSRPVLALLIALGGASISEKVFSPFVPLPAMVENIKPLTTEEKTRLAKVTEMRDRILKRQIENKPFDDPFGVGTGIGKVTEWAKRLADPKEKDTPFLFQLRNEYYSLTIPQEIKNNAEWMRSWAVYIISLVVLSFFSNSMANGIVDWLKRARREKNIINQTNEQADAIIERVEKITQDIHMHHAVIAEILNIKVPDADKVTDADIIKLVRDILRTPPEFQQEKLDKVLEAKKKIEDGLAELESITSEMKKNIKE